MLHKLSLITSLGMSTPQALMSFTTRSKLKVKIPKKRKMTTHPLKGFHSSLI